MPNELYLPTPESGMPFTQELQSPRHPTLRNAIQPLRHLSMGAHKLYPAYLNRQMGCVPSHGKNPGRSVHGRTATTLAGLKLRRDKLLCYAPSHFRVMWLHWLGPVSYYGHQSFSKTIFLHLPPAISLSINLFIFINSRWGRATPFQGFRNTSFLENIFSNLFKEGSQPIVRLFFEKRRQG